MLCHDVDLSATKVSKTGLGKRLAIEALARGLETLSGFLASLRGDETHPEAICPTLFNIAVHELRLWDHMLRLPLLHR